MPDCKNCVSLVNNECIANIEAKSNFGRPVPPPPIGSCTIEITKIYANKIKKGDKVLDIGCGSWSFLRDHCDKVGALYEGIDTQKEYYGVKTVATKIENLADLSYPDNFFDFVIGNQTIEHWGEFGCDTIWGMYQCFRVCKVGGYVFMNAPIHYHGVSEFVNGDFEKINEMFGLFSSTMSIENWGENSYPLERFIAHKNFRKLRNKHAYIIDINAKKDKLLPKISPNKSFIPMKIKRWMNYDLSYLFYLFLKKF
jgi:SAM-dependent methyltransferase